jgi:hypothetical protein
MHQDQQWLEGYSWMDQDTFLSGVGSAQTLFECLGTVVFEDKTYTGYWANDRLPGIHVAVGKIVELGRTLLVDGRTGLPAYEIFAPASQLDSPVWKIQYTYPRDIMIEPPA